MKRRNLKYSVNQKRPIKSKWLQVAALSLIFLGVYSCSGVQKTSSQESSSPSGQVEVNGSSKDEKPTDFKQADESVQIGGVNLTDAQSLSSDSDYVVTATAISSTGPKVIYTGSFSTNSFNFSIPAKSITQVSVLHNGYTLCGLLAPSYGNSKANLVVSDMTNIACKLISIIQTNAQAGNEQSAHILSHHLVSIAEVYKLASAIKTNIFGQSTAINSATSKAAIDLSKLAAGFVTATNAVSATYDSATISKQLSASFYYTIAGSDAPKVPSNILAYQSNTGLGNDFNAIAYNTTLSAGNIFIRAAYVAEAAVYTTVATTTSAVSSAMSVVSSAYVQTFKACVDSEDSCTAVVNKSAGVMPQPSVNSIPPSSTSSPTTSPTSNTSTTTSGTTTSTTASTSSASAAG